jgi:hypothetical protein
MIYKDILIIYLIYYRVWVPVVIDTIKSVSVFILKWVVKYPFIIPVDARLATRSMPVTDFTHGYPWAIRILWF